LQYLARYTHRVAISNHRLIGMGQGKVMFRWKDYVHGGKQRAMTLAAQEFIRCFLLHVLPKGMMRIRHYGWMWRRKITPTVAQGVRTVWLTKWLTRIEKPALRGLIN
jgi:hypothetical protein